MLTYCLQCGARLSDGKSCQDIHEELLQFEMLHAIPHSIHFMHVTCFLIQHERYSDQALAWARSMLQIHLDERLTEVQLLHSLRAEGKRLAPSRTWKYHRAPDAPALPKIAWPVTIVDVAQHLENGAMYGAQVKQWARTTLQHMIVPAC